VYANKIAAIDDLAERAAFVEERRREYEEDVDLYRLASELIIDAVVPFESLRDELIGRFASADPCDRDAVEKRHAVYMG
jgi:acetyl-CoA carboxylase carboxyltransferase component